MMFKYRPKRPLEEIVRSAAELLKEQNEIHSFRKLSVGLATSHIYKTAPESFNEIFDNNKKSYLHAGLPFTPRLRPTDCCKTRKFDALPEDLKDMCYKAKALFTFDMAKDELAQIFPRVPKKIIGDCMKSYFTSRREPVGYMRTPLAAYSLSRNGIELMPVHHQGRSPLSHYLSQIEVIGEHDPRAPFNAEQSDIFRTELKEFASYFKEKFMGMRFIGHFLYNERNDMFEKGGLITPGEVMEKCAGNFSVKMLREMLEKRTFEIYDRDYIIKENLPQKIKEVLEEKSNL